VSGVTRAELSPLVAALIRDEPEATLVGLLRQTLPPGLGAGAAMNHAVLQDTAPGAAAAMAAAFPAWADRGFVPLRVKPLRLPGSAREVLRVVLLSLRRCGFPASVPQWVAGDALLTLQLPGAVDLRVLSGSDPAVAGAARSCGLRLLDDFVGVDSIVREMVARQTAGPPPFPVAERYAAALAALARCMGGDVVARLPAAIADAPGPRVFFCDPKPANLMLVMSAVEQWRRTGTPVPVGIDLDLAYYDSSYVLQAVLATFSAPLPTDPAEFDACRAQAHAACARHGVEPDEVDRLLVYHLVRNLTTAIERAQRSKASMFADALALADEALGLGVCVPAGDRLRDATRSPAGTER
jgi:hypothetical protein